MTLHGTTILQNGSSKRTSRFLEREGSRRKRNSTERAGRGNDEDEFEKKLEGRAISKKLSLLRFARVNFCSALDDLYATFLKWKPSPWSHRKLARLY